MSRWIAFWITVVIGAAVDLWSKFWAFEQSGLVYSSSGPRDTIQIIPGWLDLILAKNDGAAFSLFAGQFNFFMVISVVAVFVLVYFTHIAKKHVILVSINLGLILAGVIGNFWDRVVFESVRDFIVVHTPDTGFLFIDGRHEWPTFNVADIWICVGAGVVAVLNWNEEEAEGEAPEAGEAAPEGDLATVESPSDEAAPEDKVEAAAAPNPGKGKKKKGKKKK